MSYTKTVWENLPSTNTPLNATNLNKIENELETLDSGKQDTLVSGTNIKTINNTSVLGSGNIEIEENQVIVSPTEPSGSARKKVWLQHTENLLDNKESKVYSSNTNLGTISTGVRAITPNGTPSSFATIDIGALADFVGKKVYVKFTKTSSSNNGKVYIGKGNIDHTSREIIAMTPDLTENGNYEFNTDTIVADSSKSRLFIALYSNGSGVQAPSNSYVDYTNLIVSLEDIPYEPYVEDKEYILNNNVYEEFMPKNETETIRNNDGLVLKRNGNVINFYTTKYITNGTLEGYTIPEEYRPKEVLQVSCMAYFPSTYWQPRHIGNKANSLNKFQIEVADGHQDTNYVYASFNFTWFI